MTTTNTGGPAFPVNRATAPKGSVYAKSMVISDGLTLRDYFAAKAMQGLLAVPDLSREYMVHHLSGEAYEIADRMLAERRK